MFENLNWWEIGGLLVIALLIFGDRLPNVINDGLRMLRSLRAMANNATSDLSRELGTNIQLTDLHPKTFIRKHLLSEDDEAALRRPLERLRDDLRRDVKGVHGELKDVVENVSAPSPIGLSAPAPTRAPAPAPTQASASAPTRSPAPAPTQATTPGPARRGYDLDAT